MAFETETFHLNIGVGDCTIVCLKEFHSPKLLPVLHKVVLIDGGLPTQGKVISKFLTDQLPRLFDLEEYPDGIVRIDTVVITHWDEDHYGGISSFLAEGLTPKNPPSQFKHFRYDNGTPTTYMYVPYMTKSDQQKKPDHFAVSANATDRLKFKIKVGSKSMWCEDVCLLQYGADQVMGVNFFTNERNPTTMDFPARPKNPTIISVVPFNDLASLITSFVDMKDGDPGLFCIACNNFVFQKPPPPPLPDKVAEDASHAAPSPHDAHWLIIDKPTGKSDSEQTNSASIIAVLAWKNTASKETRVSHYLAGDALWEQEAAVTKWLAPTCKVANVKLSHHGGAWSSPVSLFKQLNPANVIVSAGSKHGHPRRFILFAHEPVFPC
jgi:hypothetical protein